MDSSKRPRPKGLEGRDLEKRPKETDDDDDTPSPETLFHLFCIVRDHAKDISPPLAKALHDGGFCQDIDIPACDVHWLTCCLCKGRKKRTGHNAEKYIYGMCKGCLLDVATYVKTRPTHQIRKFVCTKDEKTGNWKAPTWNEGGEVLHKFTVYQNHQLFKKLTDTLPKGEGATGEFYIWERGMELVPEQNS